MRDDIVTIYLDGKEIKAYEGETILQAALRNGIEIPNLCYYRRVSHTAACRLCIVDIEGRPSGIPSCTTPVEEGMKITVFSEKLERIRRTILDLALSNHNDDCISCVKDGSCELQDLAFRYNLGKKERLFPPIWEELDKTSDFSSQILDYDASKCIQCNRCLKACYEIQGKGILSFVNRGIKTTVGTGFDEWKDSKCDGCGECVQICPVGALTSKPHYGHLKRTRTKDIENMTTTTCPYCGVGCQLDIATKTLPTQTEPTKTIIKVYGANKAPNYQSTCVKGRFGLNFITHPDRLKKPLIRKNEKLVEVEWDEALLYTIEKLWHIKKTKGSDAIAGLSSARCTNEENFIFQKFFRSVIGTNNVDHCARLCHASTVAGLAAAFGSGAMTNSIEELEHADVILVTGSNTTETHPVIAKYIKRAVLFRKAKLIVIDPRKIDLVRYSTLWLRQKGGTDVAWISGMMNIIMEENLHDEAFISNRTENFEALKDILPKYTPEKVEEITGIPAADLIQAAKIFANTDKGTIIYSMGITQHSHGTDNVKSLANLAMLTGNIGKESTGVNPLRGQNNVQGACDMGALPNVFPGYQKVVDRKSLRKFEKAWNTKLSDKIGLTVIEMMNAICEGKIKAMYIMGENPMISDPNTNHVREALESLDFLVCQDIFLTETAQMADVVLPVCSFAEKEGTFTNTERRVLPIQKVVEPTEGAKEDWKVIQALAQGMGSFWEYTSVSDIVEEINRLVPQYAGITWQRMKDGERLQWPCYAVDHPGTKFLHQGKFTRGKGLFSAVEYLPSKELPDDEYPFVLSTGRTLFHYHTCSMTRRTKALPEYIKEAYMEICKEDLEKMGVQNEEKVIVSSRRGSIEIKTKETEKVKEGNVFIPFHFAEAAANVLTIDALDPAAKIPELKVCAVKIEKL